MKIKKGWDGGLYIVFPDSYKASKWQWFFNGCLKMPVTCFGQFENAYEIPRIKF